MNEKRKDIFKNREVLNIFFNNSNYFASKYYTFAIFL